jgi:aerobic-type carbon monoxide dehydrogenase small subunit (CoxS/CutS family)
VSEGSSLPVRPIVNDAAHDVSVEPRFTLADVLRHHLRLTATRVQDIVEAVLDVVGAEGQAN